MNDNTYYEKILKLLISYDRCETFTRDEWDLLNYYQELGYWLDSQESTSLEWRPLPPERALYGWVDDSNPQHIVDWYLMQGEA